MADSLYLLVGLGNPGSKYDQTRHNIGFIVLDYLAERIGVSISKSKMQGLYAKARCCGESVILLKPQTYMNRSGSCVRQFVDYFDVEEDHILVLHDDIDLPCGRIKAVAKGGAGGHNGIKSIIQHMGSREFSRMKIGVGRPETGGDTSQQPVDKYVLSGFPKKEQTQIRQRFDDIEEGVELFIRQDIQSCMNFINRHPR